MQKFIVYSFLCFYSCFSDVFGQIRGPSLQYQDYQYSDQAQFNPYTSSRNYYNQGSSQNFRFPNQYDDQSPDFTPNRPRNYNQFGLNPNIYLSNNNPRNYNRNKNVNTNYENPLGNVNGNFKNNENNGGFSPSQDYKPKERYEEGHQNVESTTGLYTANNPFRAQNSATEGLMELKPIDINNRNDFDESQACRTVDGGNGNCVVILNCQPYIGVLMRARSSASAKSLLRNAHCGFEKTLPKVCCPPTFSTDPPPNSNAFSTAPPPSNVPFTTTTPAPTFTTTTTPKPTAAPKEEVTDPPEVDLYDGVLPDPPVCGTSNATWSRVVGGVPAKLGDFPWMALLGYKNRAGSIAWRCGGTLITDKHVLSAAHCVHNHENDLTTIRLGELVLETDDDGATPIDILIKKKIKHEDYNARAFTNDIAILVLEQTVTFTHLIRPVCIMKSPQLRSQTYENYKPMIAGWGAIGYRKESALHLQVLQIPVVSNEFCAQAFASYKSQVIDRRVLCAGYKNGGKDACQGDSGGPLLQPIYNPETRETFFYQLGVVSYGKECALANFPGVYSRVTFFTSWIHDTVKNNRD